MVELPGVDLAALGTWLDSERPGLRRGELSGEVIAGGKSNLTYRITDGTSTWALRRPPLAHVLPTAHDMVREYTVISALAGTDVPVAEPIALCVDESTIGARFYLMGFVDGVVLDKPDVIAGLSGEQARRSCELMMDTLAALHDVDPAAVGLADFGRPAGFLQRQVRRWHQQWDASETQPRAELTEVVDRLAATLPEQSAPGIVHGDYRLTNLMFPPDASRIAAVVDWEMATLGDPLCDLGLLIVYQSLAGGGDAEAEEFVGPRLAPSAGFLTVPQMIERYAQRSSRDLSRLDWYTALGYFKLAVVAEGINARYLQGKTVGAGFDHFGPAVPGLLRHALGALATSV